MYYVKQIENTFIKYKVSFDEQELRSLKNNIILNCGEIHHFSYESSQCKHDLCFYFLRNFSAEFVRVKEYNDFFSSSEEIYHYTYDLYDDTPLSLLIDRLLEGDFSAISQLEKPKAIEKKDTKEVDLQTKINVVLDTDIKNIDTWKLEQLKKEIEEFQIYQKLNEKRESELKYYPMVLELITMEEVQRIDTTKIEKANDLLSEAHQLIDEVQPFFADAQNQPIPIATYQKTIGKLVN